MQSALSLSLLLLEQLVFVVRMWVLSCFRCSVSAFFILVCYYVFPSLVFLLSLVPPLCFSDIGWSIFYGVCLPRPMVGHHLVYMASHWAILGACVLYGSQRYLGVQILKHFGWPLQICCSILGHLYMLRQFAGFFEFVACQVGKAKQPAVLITLGTILGHMCMGHACEIVW